MGRDYNDATAHLFRNLFNKICKKKEVYRRSLAKLLFPPVLGLSQEGIYSTKEASDATDSPNSYSGKKTVAVAQTLNLDEAIVALF
jgi:hypothetical protein